MPKTGRRSEKIRGDGGVTGRNQQRRGAAETDYPGVSGRQTGGKPSQPLNMRAKKRGRRGARSYPRYEGKKKEKMRRQVTRDHVSCLFSGQRTLET